MSLPLFVYGTFKEGAEQGSLLAGLKRRNAEVSGALYQLPGGRPAMTLAGDEWIQGELVEDPGPTRLKVLDYCEGTDDGPFTRTKTNARIGLRSVRAWVYVIRSAPRGAVHLSRGHWSPRHLR